MGWQRPWETWPRACVTLKETRIKLIHGLLRLHVDQGVDGYYDSALLKNYSTRYYLFILAVLCVGIVAILCL